MISLKSVVTACVIAVVLSCAQPVRSQELDSRPELRTNLSECIRLALKNSHARKAHEYSIRAAEARLKQAQSGRYPALDFAAAYMVTDEDVNFIFPASTVQTSPIDLGMLSLPSLNVGIPQQDIKMADKRNALAELNLVWPLFTGGKVTALVKQARAGMALATCESRADDNRIVYETKKLYYSAVLASNLSKITRETRDRLLATLKVTERLYQEGSGKVTKSDYLKNKVYVEVAQSLLDQISGEGENASAALAEAMGLDWGMKIAVADEEIPFIVTEEPMDSLVNRLFRWNPQITRVEHALDLYRAKIADARSARFPTLALITGYRRILSTYDAGMTTPENKNLWTLGIGMKMNLFNGFRTGGVVEENKAILDRIAEQREMLKRGLALSLQVVYQKLQTAVRREKSLQEAVNAGLENSQLVERAYFSDIMELKDLLQVQLTEAFIKAQYQMIRFESADLRAQLDMLLANPLEASGI